LQKWKFYPATENLPVTLQLDLLLLGCTLSLYPWTISRTVAGIILAFTLFGVTSYIFLTLAATLLRLPLPDTSFHHPNRHHALEVQ